MLGFPILHLGHGVQIIDVRSFWLLLHVFFSRVHKLTALPNRPRISSGGGGKKPEEIVADMVQDMHRCTTHVMQP